MIMGLWNVNRGPCNVIMGLWNVNRGPWNVKRGPWNVNRVPWNAIKDLECDYGTVEYE